MPVTPVKGDGTAGPGRVPHVSGQGRSIEPWNGSDDLNWAVTSQEEKIETSVLHTRLQIPAAVAVCICNEWLWQSCVKSDLRKYNGRGN